MKTRTDGYFYKPSIPTDLLKIELLFNALNLTGDQTGGASPYDTIANYPDGKVELKDIYFIDKKYGSDEGDVGWDYMADVIPDRKIDMKDYYTTCKNFGYYGSYPSLDLAGVTATFSTGEVRTPDSYGFVEIPQGATSFNITRYGNPIGAMVIFWQP